MASSSHNTAPTAESTTTATRSRNLFWYPEVTLLLPSYFDDRRLLSRGHFCIKFVVGLRPLFFISCTVDDQHCPLGKDMIIIRTGRRSFALLLPDIIYGLEFPPHCQDRTIRTVHKLFNWTSTLTDLAGENGYPFQEADEEFWPKVFPRIVIVGIPKLVELCHFFGSERHGRSTAFLVSATTRMIRDAILCDYLMLTGVEFLDGRPSTSSRINSFDTFPSATIVTNLVQAIEFDKPRLLAMFLNTDSSSTIPTGWKHEILPDIDARQLAVRLWRINRPCMYRFLRMLLVDEVNQAIEIRRKRQEAEVLPASEGSDESTGRTNNELLEAVKEPPTAQPESSTSSNQEAEEKTETISSN